MAATGPFNPKGSPTPQAHSRNDEEDHRAARGTLAADTQHLDETQRISFIFTVVGVHVRAAGSATDSSQRRYPALGMSPVTPQPAPRGDGKSSCRRAAEPLWSHQLKGPPLASSVSRMQTNRAVRARRRKEVLREEGGEAEGVRPRQHDPPGPGEPQAAALVGRGKAALCNPSRGGTRVSQAQPQPETP